jgi:Heterokaryon incompatibility protein (HET)
MPPLQFYLRELEHLFPNHQNQDDTTAGPVSLMNVQEELYQRLDEGEKEIRLIHIHPANGENDKIECTLFKAVLSDDLAFTALSYVWGDTVQSEEIVANGVKVCVTANLACAIRHIRATRAHQILESFWADAICINQSDTYEKNHQVRLMGSIYSKAILVIGWLGPETQDSTFGIDLAWRISVAQQDAKRRGDFTLDWLEIFPDLWKMPQSPDDFDASVQLPRSYRAFSELSRSSLFDRGWVFQEAILSRFQIYMCGNAVISSIDLYWCRIFLKTLEHSDVHSRPSFMTSAEMLELQARRNKYFLAFELYRRFSHDQEHLTLFPLLAVTRRLKVTNPRDKIYALLGLVKSDIDVDYGKPIDQLFIEVVEVILQENEKLHFLTFAGQHNGMDPNRISLDLPSWAPDWLAVSKCDSFSVNARWSGSALSRRYDRAIAICLPSEKLLQTVGVVLDVGKVSTPVLLDDITTATSTIQDYLLQGPALYPTGIPRLQALVRVLMNIASAGWTFSDTGLDPERVCDILLVLALFQLLNADNDLRERCGWAKDRAFGSYFQERFLGTDAPIQVPTWPTIEDPKCRYLTTHTVGLKLHEHSSNQYHLVSTEKGYLGLSVCPLRPDDIIAVLPGYQYLVALRKSDSQWIFVGSCWILGFMEGEALNGVDDILSVGKCFELR